MNDPTLEAYHKAVDAMSVLFQAIGYTADDAAERAYDAVLMASNAAAEALPGVLA